MRHLFIVNPAAGKRGTTARLEAQLDLAAYLARLDFPVEYLHCEYHACLDDPGLIRRLGRRGVGVTPWTPDDPEDLRQLAALSPDGIITNRPDLLLKLLGR